METDAPTSVTGALHRYGGPRYVRSVVHTMVRIIVIGVVLIGGYFVLPFDRASAAESWVAVGVALAVLLAVNVLEFRGVLASDTPTLRGIEALVISVVVALVTFASLYLAMSGRDAAAFDEPLDHIGALYFTLTTLTTIGFGDIAPVSDSARVVVMVQMVVNVIVLGVFVKLVTTTVRSRLGRTG
jgi:hypothetical protein